MRDLIKREKGVGERSKSREAEAESWPPLGSSTAPSPLVVQPLLRRRSWRCAPHEVGVGVGVGVGVASSSFSSGGAAAAAAAAAARVLEGVRVPGELGARDGASGGGGAAGAAAADYAREVKQLRREYAYEVELQRVERARRDEARREAARLANEQRKAAKAAAAQTRAAERRAFEEDFRQTLLKERAEKLESWRAKEKSREEKKAAQKELLRQQSSMWVSEENLEKRILEAIVDATPL
uniref:Uncharacterized protein n=1 Tax=Ananas comosus var. bracteatus TaxID=296719 RepID=A0A6V7Q132_ANACO|nr:unnamed protein product [Ananas comosus var. bracteatus]